MKKFKVCLCILLFVLLSGCFNQVSPSNKPSTYYISYLNNTVSDNLGNSYEIKKVTKKENFIYLYGYFIFVDFVSLKNMTLMIPNSNNIEIALKQTKSFNLLDDNVDKINYEGNFVIIFNDDCIDYNIIDTLSFNLCITQKGYEETYLYVKKIEIEYF